MKTLHLEFCTATVIGTEDLLPVPDGQRPVNPAEIGCKVHGLQ